MDTKTLDRFIELKKTPIDYMNLGERNEYYELLEDVVTELLRLREATRWIPVEERLPERKQVPESTVDSSSDIVLVDWFHIDYNENSDNFGDTWRSVEKAYLFNDTWFNMEAEEYNIDDPDVPTVWMPLPGLPQPPEGGDNGQ